MDLKEILAISGQSGLYKYISQGRQGIIVESFADKKRTCVYASQKVTTLQDIAIYTDEKEVPLADIFKNIYKKEEGGEAINYKSSPEELKNYMAEILPNYDREKVYVSDIKKVINWYNILLKLDLLKFDEEKEEKEKEGVTAESKEDQKADIKEDALKAKKTDNKFKEHERKEKPQTKKKTESKVKRTKVV